MGGQVYVSVPTWVYARGSPLRIPDISVSATSHCLVLLENIVYVFCEFFKNCTEEKLRLVLNDLCVQGN